MKIIQVKEIFANFICMDKALRLPKHHVVFLSGAPANSFYIILEGSVSVHKETDESSFLIGELTRGEIFGELGIFSDDHRRSTKITCKEKVVLAEVSYEDFINYTKKDIEPLIYLYGMLSNRLEETTNRTENIVTQDVTHRVWNLILELSRKEQAATHPQGRQIKISRKEIGQMIGCSREMAGKAVSVLTASGKISSLGKKIVVYHDSLNS